MTSLSGKTAIVTGGAKGIGRTLSLGLIRAGANVVASGRDEAALRQLINELDGEQESRCVTLRADVTRESECRQLFDTSISSFGRIDILVNNAGRGMREINEDFFIKPQPFWEADSDVWRAIIDTNVNGPFLMAKAVAPHMVESGWGRIISISANYETMQLPGFAPYGPSKATLEALTAIFAKDLEGTGVTVNSLLPGGATWSEMIPSNLPEEVQARILDPQIMVAPLLWLCSEASDKWTGDGLRRRLGISPSTRPKPLDAYINQLALSWRDWRTEIQK